jgi:hypothetical protein
MTGKPLDSFSSVFLSTVSCKDGNEEKTKEVCSVDSVSYICFLQPGLIVKLACGLHTLLSRISNPFEPTLSDSI